MRGYDKQIESVVTQSYFFFFTERMIHGLSVKHSVRFSRPKVHCLCDLVRIES
jgi:hypothetical protein